MKFNETDILARIEAGDMLGHIADSLDVSRTVLTTWLSSDTERSARAREARIKASVSWDEMATRGIEEAQDAFGLAKAKELAHHYRWRASKIAPRDYGDKVTQEVTGAAGGPLEVVVRYVQPKVSE